jgi:hypothetical protein
VDTRHSALRLMAKSSSSRSSRTQATSTQTLGAPFAEPASIFTSRPMAEGSSSTNLGRPGQSHPCTDNPVVRSHFSSAEGRRLILATTEPTTDSTRDTPDSLKEKTPTETQRPAVLLPKTLHFVQTFSHSRSQASHFHLVAARRARAMWLRDGWMPFVVTKIVSRLIGIEAEGRLFLSSGKESVSFRISQTSTDAMLYRTRGHLKIGCSFVQNTNPILSALNECPILVKKDPDLENLILSSFLLARNGEIEEITLSVVGTGRGDGSGKAT